MDAVVEKYNAAMIEFQDSSQALMKDSPLFGAGTGAVQLVGKYEDELQAIDLSECPEDFRVAFVAYYQSLGSLKTYLEANTGWRGALKGFIDPLSILSIPTNTDKALQPWEQAGRERELVCTKYNIGIK